MERRTNSPYPSIDRPSWPAIGVVLVVGTGSVPVERSRARLALLPVPVSASRRRAVRRGKGRRCAGGYAADLDRRSWRADRCITCHQGVNWKGFETAEQPYRTHPREPLTAHPIEKFGCTSCHGGQGWAVDTGPRTARSRTGRSRSSAARSARVTRSPPTRTRSCR